MKRYIISNPEYNNEHNKEYTLQELQALYPRSELREENTFYDGRQVDCIRDEAHAEIAINAEDYRGG